MRGPGERVDGNLRSRCRRHISGSGDANVTCTVAVVHGDRHSRRDAWLGRKHIIMQVLEQWIYIHIGQCWCVGCSRNTGSVTKLVLSASVCNGHRLRAGLSCRFVGRCCKYGGHTIYLLEPNIETPSYAFLEVVVCCGERRYFLHVCLRYPGFTGYLSSLGGRLM